MIPISSCCEDRGRDGLLSNSEADYHSLFFFFPPPLLLSKPTDYKAILVRCWCLPGKTAEPLVGHCACFAFSHSTNIYTGARTVFGSLG